MLPVYTQLSKSFGPNFIFKLPKKKKKTKPKIKHTQTMEKNEVDAMQHFLAGL